jgi:hypothetical protein
MAHWYDADGAPLPLRATWNPADQTCNFAVYSRHATGVTLLLFDAAIGRTLPRLLRKAGLVDVHVNPLIHVYPPGHGRRNILLDFAENLSERVLAEELIAERELTALKIALQRHLDNPDTLVVSHLFFQAWGRKPE